MSEALRHQRVRVERDAVEALPDEGIAERGAAAPAIVLGLQRNVGNRAVAQWLAGSTAPVGVPASARMLQRDLEPGGGPTTAAAAEPLRRHGDGAVFRTSAPPTILMPVRDDWVDEFLRFYDFAAQPAADGEADDRCMFNFESSTIGTVLGLVDQQAVVAGFSADRGVASAVVNRLVAGSRAAHQRGGTVAEAIKQGRVDDALRLLADQRVGPLLETLQTVRAAGGVAALSEHLGKNATAGTARVRAAVLTVQGHFTSRWSDALQALPDDEQDEIRRHAYNRMLAGDVGDHPPLSRRSDGASFHAPPDLDNRTWIEQFLRFFEFGAPILHADPAGVRCRFNSADAAELRDVIDKAVEQAALAGRLVQRDEVRDLAGDIRQADAAASRLGPSAAKAAARRQIVLGYSFVPTSWQADVTTGKAEKEKPANQGSGSLVFKLHPEDQPGWEISVGAQVTLGRDEHGKSTWAVTPLVAGAAWVVPFFKGFLEISVFGQLLAGAATMRTTTDGALTVAPVGQAALGAQYMFTIPGTGGHLKIGGQGAVQFTGAAGEDLPQKIDFTPAVVLGVEF